MLNVEGPRRSDSGQLVAESSLRTVSSVEVALLPRCGYPEWLGGKNVNAMVHSLIRSMRCYASNASWNRAQYLPGDALSYDLEGHLSFMSLGELVLRRFGEDAGFPG